MMNVKVLALVVGAILTVPVAMAQVPGMPVRPVATPIEQPESHPDAALLAADELEGPVTPAADPILAASELRDQVASVQATLPSAAQSGTASRPSPSSLTLTSGRNEIVQIARSQPNRFITPFDVPVVRFANELTTVDIEGRQVYVTTTSRSPVTIYIEDDSNPENAFVLTLMPREVPAVSMTLRMEGLQPGRIPASIQHAQAHEQSDHFVAVLRDTFKTLAQGAVPSGYGLTQTVDRRGAPECLMPGMQMEPGQTVTGSEFIVYVARLTNVSRIPQSVDEESCAADSVLAVAAWPYVELMPGQSTELYVATRRYAPPPANARPSLIN